MILIPTLFTGQREDIPESRIYQFFPNGKRKRAYNNYNKMERKRQNMLFSELKCKDVINVRDCKKLGHVCDLEFDECSGCICKIMVPGGNQWLGFLRCEPNIVIPYKDIRQIGPDIILVDINC